MKDSARIRQLREQIKRHDETIAALKTERDAMKREIEEERQRSAGTDREQLINLGRKVRLQLDSGMNLGEIARAQGCSRARVNEALNTWKHFEGLPQKRTAD